MANIKSISVGRKDQFAVKLEFVRFKEGQNPREDFSHVEDLAHSIMQYGQLEPIKVKMADDGYADGVHGESRYRAILLANEKYGADIEKIDCMSAPKDYTEADIMMEHFERGSTNKPLTALECAKVYKYLRDEMKYSAVEIADRCRKSDTHVYDHLKLLEAPLTVLEAVRAGNMSAAAAIEVAKAPKHKQQTIVDKLKKGSSSGDSGPREKPEKITKSDVEEEFDGVPRQISTKIATKRIQVCNERIHAARKGSKEQVQWEGVKYGLESGLGMHEENWRDD